MAERAHHRYLGRGGAWPRFELSGLEVADDGSLRLPRLPSFVGEGDTARPRPGVEGPTGVGVDEDGNVYFSEPGRHRVLRIDACDGSIRPLGCLRGPGAGIGSLNVPRGVAVGPGGILYVADSRNARIQSIDLGTAQVRGVFGGLRHGDRGGGGLPTFHEPWDVAVDARGRLYVADPGERTVAGAWRHGSLRRFGSGGAPDNAFEQVLARQEVVPEAPSGIALVSTDDESEDRLLVLDLQPSRILVYRTDGSYDAEGTRLWTRAAGQVVSTGSIAFDEGRLYVTGPGGRVLVFGADGSFHGSVATGAAEASGLALDCRGRLLVNPGTGKGVVRGGAEDAHANSGAFLAGPFESERVHTRWERLRLRLEGGPPTGAHVRIFTLTSDCLDGADGRRPALELRAPGEAVPDGGLDLTERAWIELPACAEPMRHEQLATPGETPRGEWASTPWDVPDLDVSNEAARYLWIAGVFRGDGTATPVLRELRLDHDRDGWFRRLPGVYRRDARSRGFLDPMVLLFETVHEDSEARISDLPSLFDPAAAPDGPEAPWLDWLAGWFDLPLVESWSESLRRETTGRAFELQARRGTAASLRERIRLYAGVPVEVVDGARSAGVWVLGDTPFGSGLRLTAADPDGAVLGTTATLDRSHLIRAEEAGAPLFDGVVHCFAVLVHRADVPDQDALAHIRDVIEREKPAHTDYRLCVIEPRMRVGFQSTLGVDTVVAGPPTVAAWDGARRLGADTVLPADRARREGETRLGGPAKIGFKLA